MSTPTPQRPLSLPALWNMSFGFLGIQSHTFGAVFINGYFSIKYDWSQSSFLRACKNLVNNECFASLTWT